MHANAKRANVELLPEGWFSEADIAAYRSLYEMVPVGGTTAELGVWQGRSLCAIAAVIRARRLHVHAIDTFGGTEGERDVVHDCGGKLQEVFEANLERFGIRAQVEVHAGSTGALVANFPDASLDLVFIDADHRYEQTLADVRAWLPKVKPGGMLCGHDYKRPWRHFWGHDRSGVKRAVDEVLGKKRVKLFSGSSVWSWK
jgi:SAM-dependent methyltransferase